MNLNKLKEEVKNLETSVNYYKDILNMLKTNYSQLIEFYFIKYLIFIKLRKLRKLKEKLAYLEKNMSPNLKNF